MLPCHCELLSFGHVFGAGYALLEPLLITGWVISMSLFLQDCFNFPSSNSVQSVSLPQLPESYLILGLRVSAASGWIIRRRVSCWCVLTCFFLQQQPLKLELSSLVLGVFEKTLKIKSQEFGQHSEIPYCFKTKQNYVGLRNAGSLLE